MRRGAAIVIACLLTAACAGGVIGNRFRPEAYIVRPGDTLYSIAWRYRIDHQDLMRWNGIDDPRSVQAGRELRLYPDGAATASSASSSSSGATVSTSGSTATTTASRGTEDTASEPVRERKPVGDPPGRWQWPTRGDLIGTFGDGKVAGRGIDIGGEVGQPVQATAAGEVVYSGEGLKAYGRLLIIRHEGDFLSAYAHNSELLVAEGDRVDRGQPIARMGRSRDGSALLHFEIRRGGNPVDPLDYLPQRD